MRAAAGIALLLTFPALCAAQAGVPVAKPTVKVGERWTYRRMDYWTDRPMGTYELRVTFSDGDAILTVATEQDGSQRDASWTSEWNATVSSLNQAIISPDSGLLDFPLEVGATHETDFHLQLPHPTGTRGRRSYGDVDAYDYRYDVTVLGWEEVVVPAGKFRALKVEAQGYRQLLAGVGWPTGTAPARTVIWYAPEVKRWVKYRYEDGSTGSRRGPNDKYGEELVRFSLR